MDFWLNVELVRDLDTVFRINFSAMNECWTTQAAHYHQIESIKVTQCSIKLIKLIEFRTYGNENVQTNSKLRNCTESRKSIVDIFIGF